MEFIDLKSQMKRIRSDLDRRLTGILDSGQFIMGPEVGMLEGELSKYVGVKHAITCANGTDALQIALMSLGVGPGDEVITTPFTFIANAEAIALLGAKPVFVDIDPHTYNLVPEQIASKITSKTKAIMPVSLYGQMPDFEKINQIASQAGIAVIEDAAQSFGAEQNGKKSGAVSRIAATSFFPSKPLGCYGDGGALFTNDDNIAVQMRLIRSHGQKTRYNHVLVGVNSRLDTLQAGVLLEKLKIFPDEVQKREQIGLRYNQLLEGSVQTPVIASGNLSVFSQYTIRVKNRDQVVDALKTKGIPTSVHYPQPVHLQAAFKHLNYSLGSFPQSELAAQQVLSLPMHPYLESQVQDEIVAAVKAVAISS